MRGGSGPRSHLVGRCPLGCRLLTPAWELSPVAGNGIREGSVYTGPSAGYDVQRKGKRPPRTTGFPGHAVLQGIARPRGLVPGRGEKSAQRDCNKTLEFQARCHRPALAPPLVSPGSFAKAANATRGPARRLSLPVPSSGHRPTVTQVWGFQNTKTPMRRR